MLSKIPATAYGFLALAIWTFGAVLTKSISDVPTYQVMSIILTLACLVSVGKLAYTRQWYKLKQPLYIWVLGTIGLVGNEFFYLQAFKYAPASHVDLVNYLWPLFVVIFAALLPGEKFSLRHFLCALLGFAGVALLIISESRWHQVSVDYLYGYLYAFLDGAVWAMYVLVLRYYGKLPVEIVGIFSGVGAVLALILHQTTETTYVMNNQQLLTLIFMGFTTQGLACFAWSYAVGHGNMSFLSVCSYLVPAISILWLVVFGYTQTTLILWLSTSMVVLACLLSTLDLKQISTICLKACKRVSRSNNEQASIPT